MADARSAGKGSYVSLSMEDMKESKHSENDNEDEESKKATQYSVDTRSVMDDYLIEFNEVFRRKVSHVEIN